MQIQDNRAASSSSSDTRISTRDNRPTFAKPTLNSSSDAFAEVFQAIASSPVPKQKPGCTNTDDKPDDASLSSTPESTKADDEKDPPKVDAKADATAVVALPAPQPQAVTPKTEQPISVEVRGATKVAASPTETIADSKKLATTEAVANPLQPTHNATSSTAVAPEVIKVAAADAPVQAKPSAASTAQASPLKRATNGTTPDVEKAQANAQGKVASAPTKLVDQTKTVESAIKQTVEPESNARDPRDRRGKNERDSRTTNVNQPTSPTDRQLDAAIRAQQNTQTDAPSPTADNGLASATASLATIQNNPAAATPTVAPIVASAPAVLAAAQMNSATSTGQSSKSATVTPTVGTVAKTSESSAKLVTKDAKPASRQAEIADRARLVHRIANAFQRLGIDGGQVRLRMHPDELGSVQLDMQVSGRKVKATVIADSEEARNLLQANLPDLRQRLESQGLTVERLDVARRGEANDPGLANQNSNQHGNGYRDDAASRDGVWRRQNELKPIDKTPLAATVSLHQPTRTIASDLSLDLKI